MSALHRLVQFLVKEANSDRKRGQGTTWGRGLVGLMALVVSGFEMRLGVRQCVGLLWARNDYCEHSEGVSA